MEGVVKKISDRFQLDVNLASTHINYMYIRQ